MKAQERPLRADAERTVRAILEAAERVLSANPAATMEQIAEAAGVARTTVHRRFATREALLGALATWAARQFHEAVLAVSETTPPPVALHQVTANVLRVKLGWGFAMSTLGSEDPQVQRVHADVRDRCDRLFARARASGVLRSDIDPDWARRVYYGLIDVATKEHPDTAADTESLAARVVDTLLTGLGPAG